MSAVEYWWRNRNFPRDKAIVPGTDEVIHRGSAEQCYEAWSARCAQLGLTFDNELAVFGDCCCKALPESLRDEACAKMSDAAPEVLRQKRLIGFSDIQAFFAKSAAWLSGDEPPVTQEESTRRAEICALCPKNTKAHLIGCASCTGIVSKIAEGVFKIIGKRSTPHDHLIENCGVCACRLAILVHCPIGVIREHRDPAHQFPSHCWQRME